MDPTTTRTVTRLLAEARSGRAGAAEDLLPLVYDELRDQAGAIFGGERGGHTLQPTALVNEAWMRIAGHLADGGFECRRHFLAVAARAMRRVLTDHARRRHSDKRGGGWARVTLDAGGRGGDAPGLDLVEFHDALERLADLDPRHAQVVELRMLGGLTIAETAEALGVSHTTVENDWATAKAWLRRELGEG